MAGRKLAIALLGATGKSGMAVMQLALERGHAVKALVRSPEKVTTKHENLTIVKANVMDSQSLSDGFKDSDVVISCLGAASRDIAPGTSFYLDTMKVITAAMREANIKRIVTMTSWGTLRDSRSPYFYEYLLRFAMSKVFNSMRDMEVYLEQECSDLDYTVVRPGGLQDKPLSGKPFQVAEGVPCVPSGWCKNIMWIPRADVALFMLECAETEVYMKKAVAIAV